MTLDEILAILTEEDETVIIEDYDDFFIIEVSKEN